MIKEQELEDQIRANGATNGANSVTPNSIISPASQATATGIRKQPPPISTNGKLAFDLKLWIKSRRRYRMHRDYKGYAKNIGEYLTGCCFGPGFSGFQQIAGL